MNVSMKKSVPMNNHWYARLLNGFTTQYVNIIISKRNMEPSVYILWIKYIMSKVHKQSKKSISIAKCSYLTSIYQRGDIYGNPELSIALTEQSYQ